MTNLSICRKKNCLGIPNSYNWTSVTRGFGYLQVIKPAYEFYNLSNNTNPIENWKLKIEVSNTNCLGTVFATNSEMENIQKTVQKLTNSSICRAKHFV